MPETSQACHKLSVGTYQTGCNSGHPSRGHEGVLAEALLDVGAQFKRYIQPNRRLNFHFTKYSSILCVFKKKSIDQVFTVSKLNKFIALYKLFAFVSQ